MANAGEQGCFSAAYRRLDDDAKSGSMDDGLALRDEFQKFAEQTLQRCLSEFATSVKKILREELPRAVEHEQGVNAQAIFREVVPDATDDSARADDGAWRLLKVPARQGAERGLVSEDRRAARIANDAANAQRALIDPRERHILCSSEETGRSADGPPTPKPSMEGGDDLGIPRARRPFRTNFMGSDTYREELEAMTKKETWDAQKVLPSDEAVDAEVSENSNVVRQGSVESFHDGDGPDATRKRTRNTRDTMLTFVNKPNMAIAEEPMRKTSVLKRFVKSNRFEFIVMVAIVLNAVYIGAMTNYIASTELEMVPIYVDVIEVLFLVAFVTELLLRLHVRGIRLFRRTFADGRDNPSARWHTFDALVVILQALELLCRALLLDTTIWGSISLLRLLKLLRIGRIIRVVKLFSFVQDLRIIVYSIGRCWTTFFWSVAALFLVTYLWAVYFTEAVWQYKLRLRQSSQVADPALDASFGTVGSSMLSLLQSITGGVDWKDMSEPLDEMDFTTGLLPFLCYVFFALLAMMNVITGVFLDTATERAKEEREVLLMRNARIIFRAADHNKNGMITQPDFLSALKHVEVANFFKAIELDISEAETLFEFLDASGDGTISADEFLCGCLRLRGHAKALDLLVLSREVVQLFDANRRAILLNREALQGALEQNHQMLQEAILEHGRALVGLKRRVDKDSPPSSEHGYPIVPKHTIDP